MRLQFTLAWRYLHRRKLRTFLTTLAVVFGVMVVFCMNVILPTMLQAFQANVLAASGQVDLTITNRMSSAFPVEIAAEIAAIPGVRADSAVLERTINLPADFVDADPSRPDRITAFHLVGVDPAANRAMQVFLVQSPGRFLQAGDTNAAAITQNLADSLGLTVGADLLVPSVNGTLNLHVVGILPSNALSTNEELYVSLAQAQAITGQPGQANLINVDLTSRDPTSRARTITAIESALGSEYRVGALQAGSELFAMIDLGQAAFNLFGVLALFMGGFIIFNTFRTVVAERRRDIGMLRALGARRSTITGMVLVEGLLQGLIGSAAGLLLGYLLGAAVLRLLQTPIRAFINLKLGLPVVPISLVVTSVLLGVGVTVLSGLIPAVRASRVMPMEALRPSIAQAESKRLSRLALVSGLVLIGLAFLALASGNMALILVGGIPFLIGLILVAPAMLHPIALVFGGLVVRFRSLQGTGDLARGNLTRQPDRVTITASASMIALAIVVALGGLTTSLVGMLSSTLHKSLGSDYLFIPPSISVWSSDIGANPELASRLRAVPGVAAVSTLRYSSSQVDGQTVSLMGIDPQIFPSVSGLDFKQGDPSAYAALADGRNMIVNGAFLAAIPVKVGDTVMLATPQGSQAYRIVASGTDLLNAKVVTAFISQTNLAVDFSRTDDVFLQLDLKPGQKLSELDPQIRAIAAGYPQFTLLTGQGYLTQMLGLLDEIFAGLYVMLVLLALPSLIAMLNTLAINVLERRREIGLVRAVGATQGQVQRMVVVEALLLAAIGTALGLLSGLYLGYVMVRALASFFPIHYAFPLAGILAAIAIGLVFGGVAAILPARQASRLPVGEVVRYE